MMNNLYDILEICLPELEKGIDLEKLLARYPEHAVELRPILQASIHARSIAASEPSVEAVRRGRAALMQRAAELREEKVVPVHKTSKREIPILQRIAITFSLTATLLVSGTGLVGASSNSLPGENLYPVKRTWEDVRLFFAFDNGQRELLESEFDSERLHEANELIADGRHETIQFAGVFMDVNGKAYVSGLPVLITTDTKLPSEPIQTGAAVIVTGHTNADGFVELESMELLPAGAVVPIGEPIEVEKPESSNEENADGSVVAAPGSTSEAQGNQSQPAQESNSESFKLEGTIDSFSNNAITVNGQLVYIDGNTRIEGQIKPGSKVEVEGYYDRNGKFIVKKIKVESEKSGEGSSSTDSSSGSSNSGSGSGGGDDNSGHGGSDDHGGGDDD